MEIHPHVRASRSSVPKAMTGDLRTPPASEVGHLLSSCRFGQAFATRNKHCGSLQGPTGAGMGDEFETPEKTRLSAPAGLGGQMVQSVRPCLGAA